MPHDMIMYKIMYFVMYVACVVESTIKSFTIDSILHLKRYYLWFGQVLCCHDNAITCTTMMEWGQEGLEPPPTVKMQSLQG